MNKALKIESDIYALFTSRSTLSAPEIGSRLGVTRITSYKYLQSLIAQGLIIRQGQGRATRYALNTLGSTISMPNVGELSIKESTAALLADLQQYMQDIYDEIVSIAEIESVFDQYAIYLDSQDQIYYGVVAFILWSRDPKHNNGRSLSALAQEYHQIIASLEVRRRKNGFFDATQTAHLTLSEDTEFAIDTFLFRELSSIPDGFGRTRAALTLYYGKLNGNRSQIEQAAQSSIEPICDYIKTHSVDAVMYVPPTLGRNIQVRAVLRDMLKLDILEIQAHKITAPNKIQRPQKDIRDRQERIANAEKSMYIAAPAHLKSLQYILILDDSFTTGATPNALAQLLRRDGFTGQITAITICGNLSYDLAVTELEI